MFWNDFEYEKLILTISKTLDTCTKYIWYSLLSGLEDCVFFLIVINKNHFRKLLIQ